MKSMKKTIAALVAISMIFGCVIGGTIAWLTANSNTVTNTFTDSDVNITLTESDEDKQFQMVPGLEITKDPKVEVLDGSEDCWLFVEITESTDPDLDEYLTYAIASGWDTLDDDDNNEDTILIARKVLKDANTKEFNILLNDKVTVKEDVTKADMDAIDDEADQPTLAFKAYAVQLYKANNGGENGNEKVEFTAAEAWAKVNP